MEADPTSPSSRKRCMTQRHDEAAAKFPKVQEDVKACTNTRHISSTVKRYMEENNWFAKVRRDRAMMVCGSCIALATQEKGVIGPELSGDPQMPEEIQVAQEVKQVLSLIEDGSLSDQELTLLAISLGARDRKLLAGKLTTSSSSVQDRKDQLQSLTYAEVWNDLPSIFFKPYADEICSYESLSLEKQRRAIRHLATAVRSIFMAMNERYIDEIATSQNIVLHSYSGSKAVCQLYAAVQPSGGYSYMEKLVAKLSTDLPCFPAGDIFVAFDNQQIVGRDYRVSVAAHQPTSIVTSFAVFQDIGEYKMQFSPIPTYLDKNEGNRDMLFKKYEEYVLQCKNVHSKYLNDWISSRLGIVAAEFLDEDGSLAKVKPGIMGPLYEAGVQYDRVPRTGSNCKVIDMENLMLNPNSYQTVEKVLSTIITMSDATSPEREWIPVICDGLPYILASKLLENTLHCKNCTASNEGLNLPCEDGSNHDMERKFKKIVLRPGAGHIELNLVRAIFGAFFDPIIKPIANMLGFTTPRALDYCKKGLDHHRSWQILLIIYISISDEIMHHYVKKASEATTLPSVEGFATWLLEQRCPNIQLASDLVFNILHPLFLFRAGIRQCNDEVAMAALQKASTIFFGFNHPKYRELIVRDLMYLLTLPHLGAGPAKRFGFCKLGSTSGQGLDFLLEERNKLQKQWIFTHGTPNESQWKKSSATLTYFEQLKSNVLRELDLHIESGQSRKIPLGEAYSQARQHFRYVLSQSGFDLTSFEEDAVPIPIRFLNCAIQCQNNKSQYVRAFLSNRKCALNLMDTTDLETLDEDELKKRASAKIKQLVSKQSKDAMGQKLNKCITTAEFIEVLGELEEEICNIDYLTTQNDV